MAKYTSRRKRPKNIPRVVIQERDLAILEAIYEHRALSMDHIYQVFFANTVRRVAQDRMRKLWEARFVDRKFTDDTNRSHTLYILDQRGADELRQHDMPVKWHRSDKSVSLDFLEHTMGLGDVWMAVAMACREHGYSLSWIGERALKSDYDFVTIRTSSGRQRKVSVIPDGFFVVATDRSKYSFFLEFDRGTMSLKRFQSKILAYIAYHRTGGYEKRFKSRVVRVLTVNPNPTRKRVISLKEATEKAAKNQNWFWFAHLSDIHPESVLHSPIWLPAGSDTPQGLIQRG